MYEKIKGRYTTVIGGVRVARRELGYPSVEAIILDGDYTQIPNSFASLGDIFIDGIHVSICAGSKTLALSDDKYVLVDTSYFSDYKTYRKDS